jgi:hypothetical protein
VAVGQDPEAPPLERPAPAGRQVVATAAPGGERSKDA